MVAIFYAYKVYVGPVQPGECGREVGQVPVPVRGQRRRGAVVIVARASAGAGARGTAHRPGGRPPSWSAACRSGLPTSVSSSTVTGLAIGPYVLHMTARGRRRLPRCAITFGPSWRLLVWCSDRPGHVRRVPVGGELDFALLGGVRIEAARPPRIGSSSQIPARSAASGQISSCTPMCSVMLSFFRPCRATTAPRAEA